MSDTIHEEPELRQRLLRLHKELHDALDLVRRQVTITIYPATEGKWGNDDASATPAATEYKAFMQRYDDWSRQGMDAMEQILKQLWDDGISLSEADESGNGDDSTTTYGHSHLR
ncbi:MAG: hypothetical protein ABI068_11520 [Ktedonobacterales bacterium]